MSLISTYQSRKSLFAEKLITKGVDASASDGLTTLINKIDDISSIGNGIFLFGDKDIIQSSQSVYFNAFVVKEGKLVNDPIKIYAPDSSYVNPMTSNVSDFTKLGDSDGFTVTNEGASLSLNELASFNQVYLNKVLDFTNTNHEIMFKCKPLLQGSDAINGQVYTINGSGYDTNFWISSTQVGFCGNTFSFPSSITWGDWLDVVLSYTPTEQKIYINGILVGTTTYDFSEDYNANAFYFALFTYYSYVSFIVKNLSVFSYESIVASGSHGACLGEYVGTGSGLKNFYAQSGSFVSEIFVVTDSQFYDSGTTGTPNTEWWKNNNSLQLTSDNNGLTASNSTSSTYYLAPNEIGTPKSSMSDLVDWNDFICEFTYRSHTGTINLELRDSGGNVGRITFNNLTLSDGDVFKIQYTNNTITATLNNTPLTVSGTVSGDVMIRLAVLNANIVFKDFKVYPI